MVILVGGLVFGFSWLYFNDQENDDESNRQEHYHESVETAVGFSLFGVWILGNAAYWSEIYARKRK